MLLLFIPLLFLSQTRCAKIGSLTGGPKDSIPPVVLKTVPSNYSINFKGQKIEITFNEFITLNNVNQQLVVSPPVENRIDVRLKGKSILIDLNNELKDSTTYTLNFGESIKDNNEGNPLSNYEFVFSTGNYLDSLSIYGRLVNAFDLKPPEEPVSLLLYADLSDSAFLKHIPLYVGKSGEEGYFIMNNLKSDTFHLYALKDLNSNYRFDLPNEMIAFLDTALYVTPQFFTRAKPDTLSTDSIAGNKLNLSGQDSLLSRRVDSIEMVSGIDLSDKLLVDLYLFEESNEKQYVTDNGRKERKRLEFSFNKSVTDSFEIIPIVPEEEGWYISEVNAMKDTFNLWIKDPQVIDRDTILLGLNYTMLDSMGNYVRKIDTLTFSYHEPTKIRKKTEEAPDTIITSEHNFEKINR